MSLSKEVRIGILITAALLVFFTGFYFLKGSSLFSNEKTYYCFFKDIQGLQGSSNVQIRGLNVGRVSGTQLIDNKGVKVSIAIASNIEVPQGTVAALTSSDLLGTKVIKLELGSGPGQIEKGQELPTVLEGGIIDNLSSQMSPLLANIQGMISTLDTLLVGVNNIVNKENQQAISSSLASLNATTANIAALTQNLKQQSGEINGIIHNTNSITANLAKNNDKVEHIINNTAMATDKLAKAPIKETFDALQKSATELQGILTKINNNQGSMGALVNDKALYNNLTASLATLNVLMADLKEHPSKYVNVTVFGRKKK